MRRVVLPLLAAAVSAAVLAAGGRAAATPIPESHGVGEAAFGGGRPESLAFVRGRALYHGVSRERLVVRRIATVPTPDARAVAARPRSVLVESRTGSWLRYYVEVGIRFRALRLADAPKNGLLGRAGFVVNRAGRAVVAYSVRYGDDRTELWLVEVRSRRTRAGAVAFGLRRTRVTRNGFPPSSVPPAAAPVSTPDGTIRVVQAWSQRGANAIFWRREGARWWGRVLYTSAFGSAGLPIFAARSGVYGDDVSLAWTVAYPAQRELHVVYTTRIGRSRSVVLHRNAVAAGLVFGANHPEVAANENVAGLATGLIFSPWIGGPADRPPVELDGTIVAYTRDTFATHVILARNGRLEWFPSLERPQLRIVHLGGLSGRVEGARGGVVRVYRETAGEPRVLVAEVPLGPDGAFTATDPAPVSGTRYRFVYEQGFPYSLLLRDAVP